MPLLVPNPSEGTLLSFALGVAVPGNQYLKLFTNNVTQSDSDVLAQYTEMATQGYVQKQLTKTSWTVTPASAATASPATGVYAQQTWTFDGTGGATTVYGYMIVDVTTGLLLWAEKFATSKIVQYNGDQILLTPQITLSKV